MGVVADVQAYLEAAGIVDGSSDWTSRRRRMEDGVPDRLVVLTEDGGGVPEIPRASGIGDSALRDPAVQIAVRAAPWDGDASHDKATEIHTALHGLACVVMGSTEYVRVRARTSEPIFAGYDQRGRPLHTLSVQCMTDA